MTSKEAFKILKRYEAELSITKQTEVAYDVVISARYEISKLVERDTPMKVINGTTINGVCLDYECPSCKQGIDNSRYSKDQYYLIKHCISCGQRLDWSDEK